MSPFQAKAEETPKRTTQFVFEDIDAPPDASCLFVVCTDGSRSIANLDDLKAALAQASREGGEKMVREMKARSADRWWCRCQVLRHAADDLYCPICNARAPEESQVAADDLAAARSALKPE